MNSKSFASFVLLSSLLTTLPAWAGYTFENGVLTIDGKVELAGQSLTLDGLTSMTGTGEFTNTDDTKCSELTFNIASGKIGNGINDCKIKFSGNLRIIKTGAGTLVIASTTSGYDTHSYTGGTEIRDGMITSPKYAAMSGTDTQYGRNAVIDVYVGGKVDMCSPDHNKTTVNLYGGEITGPDKTKYSDGKQCAATINLEADSYLKPTKQFGVSGPIDLKGHTLTINTTQTLEWKPKFVSGGRILVEKGVLTFKGSVSSPEADLEVLKDGGIALGAFDCDVKDYVASNSVNSGSGKLCVYGKFVPCNDTFYPPTMMDGSSIDLSEKEGTWSATGVKYSPDSTITLKVGGRGMEDGVQLVAWDAPDYTGCTFALEGENVGGLTLGWDETGIFVRTADKTITTAEWTGAAGDGDVTNPANWTCKTAGGATIEGERPNSGVDVKIPYAKLSTINCPVGADLEYKTLDFADPKPDGRIELPADRDWRGLKAFSDFPFSIDLNGHDLALQLANGVSERALVITNSSDTVAEFRVNVAADETFDNTLAEFAGNLRFVKEGAGKFIATKYPQEYAGLTIVSNGVLACAENANLNATDKMSPFGAQKTVYVAPNGILDPRGSYLWGYHTINLDGGAISNTVEEIGVGNGRYDVGAENYPRQFNPTINLLANSTFATAQDFNFNGKVVSGGAVLKLAIGSGKNILWVPSSVGTLTTEIVSGGYLKTLKNHTYNQKNSTLVFSGGTINLIGNIAVSNYVASSSVNSMAYDNRADPRLTVYGAFKPVTANFVGCTLKNGATLDLSAQTDIWVPQGYSAHGVVDFDKDAEITIDVHGREFTGKTQVVQWVKGSTNNLENVTFNLDADSKAAGYSLFSEPYEEGTGKGGLYVGRKGMVLLFGR